MTDTQPGANVVVAACAVMTGPIEAVLVLSDGTEVNCSPPVVYVATQEQATELAALIGRHYQEHGHPMVPAGFRYDPPEE